MGKVERSIFNNSQQILKKINYFRKDDEANVHVVL